MISSPGTNKPKLTVLITGVGGRSTGHQILQAMLLVKDEYRLIVTDADAFSFGLYQGDSRYLVPRADNAEYAEAILRLIKKEDIKVILPGTEPEVQELAKWKNEIEATGCRLIINPEKVIAVCSNKWRLSVWLEDNAIGAPKTVASDNWEELVANTGFPIVGKPTEGTGASRNVAILNGVSEVESYLLEMGDKEIIFQEYVGTADDEYTVGVLISSEGKIIDSIVIHRKLIGISLGEKRTINGRSFELSTGYSQGLIVQNDIVQGFCEDLALKLGARGPLNIQCRVDADKVKVFEVHPRFSGTTSIRAKVGFNEPDVLIRNLCFGERFSRLGYQVDMAAIRAFQNMVVPISSLNGISRA